VIYLHPPLTCANLTFASVVFLTDFSSEVEFAEPERQGPGSSGRVKQVCLFELRLENYKTRDRKAVTLDDLALETSNYVQYNKV
jgi:hypothetical protein